MPEPIPEEEAVAAAAEGDAVKPAAPAAEAGGVVKH